MPLVFSSLALTPPQSPGPPACRNSGTQSAVLTSSPPQSKKGAVCYSKPESPPLSFASSAVGMRAWSLSWGPPPSSSWQRTGSSR
eukprot:9670089-Prorocentrum_lima.AAC.1